MKLRDLLEKEIKEGESVKIWITSKILETIQIGKYNAIQDGIL
jgi:hypothetical protein